MPPRRARRFPKPEVRVTRDLSRVATYLVICQGCHGPIGDVVRELAYGDHGREVWWRPRLTSVSQRPPVETREDAAEVLRHVHDCPSTRESESKP